MTEPVLMDPAAERTLVAALGYLDDVPTEDENFWSRIRQALRLVDEALGQGDPALVHAGVRELDRALTSRLIPVGAKSKEPMPEDVRELRTAVRHRIESRSSKEGDGKAAGSSAGGQARRERR